MNKKALSARAMGITLATACLLTPACAAERQEAKALQSGSITVTYKGKRQAFTNEQEDPVLPIINVYLTKGCKGA